ncbi:MAG TPA: TonB-dependent receptor [Blastocatellia bacterium]|nr:TonB-dependent receptor [Blastocatellia bacterium]
MTTSSGCGTNCRTFVNRRELLNKPGCARLVRLASVFMITSLLSGAAPGQSRSAIAGAVTDQTGAVIAGATVRVVHRASGRAQETSTDQSGRYEFTEVLSGPVLVSAKSAGFSGSARVVVLAEGHTIVVNFSLEAGQIEDAITVTPSRGSERTTGETPQSVTVTDAARIEFRRPASTLQAVEATPNLTPVGASPALERPRLRGLTSNRVLLLVDGERLNNSRTDPLSGISPSLIDVTQLEAIEVAASAGSSLYGSDALAGTINLITTPAVSSESGRRLSLWLDGSVHSNGVLGRGATALSWSSSRLAARLSGSLFQHENYNAGAGSIRTDEVVRVGDLATAMGNAVGNNVARTYAVWNLSSGAEIPNGRASGFNDQVELWLAPAARHSVRYRQINSQHHDIGFPFITPPFDGRRQFNGFRRFDKYGVRYEGRELTPHLVRLSGSFFHQKYAFPDDNLVSTINLGSSWTFSGLLREPVLTGNVSAFTPGSFTDGKTTVATYGGEVQATVAPNSRLLVTSGVSLARDDSRDEFSRFELLPGSPEPRNAVTGRATNPDSIYRNAGWFAFAEHEPLSWLRVTGGLRVDNWHTQADVTSGFPLPAENAIIASSLSRLAATPGQINLDGLRGLGDLVGGRAGIGTNRTVLTGNAGVVALLGGGFSPYFRFGTSYREPGITERYLLRDFGDPTFSVVVLPNTALGPECGRSYDGGLRVRRDRISFSVSYFRNDLRDFIRPVFAPVMFIPPDPANGLLPIAPGFPVHGVLFTQRSNTARARIQGWEATLESSAPVGTWGSITPFANLGWLKGSDLTPGEDSLLLISQFYNRSDTPVRLEGSSSDVPLTGITPFRGLIGSRFSSRDGRWSGEYELRYQAAVHRADPIELSSPIITQYGSFTSLGSIARHSVRAAYTYRKEDYRLSFSFGVENLTNRLFFEQFQTAPAPGRSFVFGMTASFSNLLHK